MNPFVFGSIVTGSNFTNRKGLIKELKSDFLSSQNVLLYGNRRIGKTSVVEQSLQSIEKKILIARIDLLGINSVQEFCSRYFNSILSLEKSNYFEKIVKTLSLIRPTITFKNNGRHQIKIGRQCLPFWNICRDQTFLLYVLPITHPTGLF